MTKLRPQFRLDDIQSLMLEHPIGQVHDVDEVSTNEDRLRLYSSARASDGQLFEGNSRPHRYSEERTSLERLDALPNLKYNSTFLDIQALNPTPTEDDISNIFSSACKHPSSVGNFKLSIQDSTYSCTSDLPYNDKHFVSGDELLPIGSTFDDVSDNEHNFSTLSETKIAAASITTFAFELDELMNTQHMNDNSEIEIFEDTRSINTPVWVRVLFLLRKFISFLDRFLIFLITRSICTSPRYESIDMIDFINGPIDDVQAQPNKSQAVDNDCHGVQKYQRFVFWLCWIFTLCFIFASGRRNFVNNIISTDCESLHRTIKTAHIKILV